MHAEQSTKRPEIGLSACLLGSKVRFDGGHKNNRFINGQLVDFVELFPVCPEVEMGLGIPRPAIQLRNVNSQIRLVVSRSLIYACAVQS